MKETLAQLRAQLGGFGLGALVLLAATAAFSFEFVQPLEERRAGLERELAESARRGMAQDLIRVSAGTPAAQMEEFYRFFERRERTDEWLAKLYGMATAAGLELRTGTYRLDESRQRFERYQVSLPVAGSYAQVRTFLEGALAGVPVMSLDQVSFRRQGVNDTRIEAEIVLTLHLLRQ